MTKRYYSGPVIDIPEGKMLLSAGSTERGTAAFISKSKKVYDPGYSPSVEEEPADDPIIGIIIQTPERAKAISDWFAMLFDYMVEHGGDDGSFN